MLHPHAHPLNSQAMPPPVTSLLLNPADANANVENRPSHRLRYPIAPWIGRLVRLDPRPGDDGIGFEVYHAPSPHQRLIRQVVSLRWASAPLTQAYVQAVTRDVRFNAIAHRSMTKGRVHPVRLNGLNQVGPLESLAGARATDSIEVVLPEPVVMSEPEGETTLVISQEPIQVTGTFYSVVTIRERLGDRASSGRDTVKDREKSDPRDTRSASDTKRASATRHDGDTDEAQIGQRFLVQHYNPDTQQFDGLREIMCIPNGPLNRNGIAQFTHHQIETSLENRTGWYVYGNIDDEGIFVVQALDAYRSLSLEPDRIICDEAQGTHYIEVENWADTPAKAGSLETVLIDGTAENREEAIAQWKEGDRGLVIHLYGGIGGKKQNEKLWFGLVTGHFSYGVATVVRDPLTQALRFDIDYYQIYGHNNDGIISGPLKRCCYAGNLQRGWLNLRPFSAIVINLDCVTQDYHFGPVTLSPFKTFLAQLQVMMARYRVGDGTGAAMVDVARCCVQDSNQALYVALQHIEDAIAANPDIQTWLKDHPNNPQTQRFRQLQALGEDLHHKLVPLGIVRPDWRENANNLTGIAYPVEPPSSNIVSMVVRALASWRTMLPRRSHDEMAKLLLKHGAKLWVIRTNQVGGTDPDTVPYAPTTLIGRLLGRNT